MTQSTTYARVIRTQGEPERADENTKLWQADILPLLKKQPGFQGVSLMGNRQTGEGLSVTYWESERSLKDSRAQLLAGREKSLQSMGRRIVEEDECEVVVQERFKPAKAGVWVRVTTLAADPSKAAVAVSPISKTVMPIAVR